MRLVRYFLRNRRSARPLSCAAPATALRPLKSVAGSRKSCPPFSVAARSAPSAGRRISQNCASARQKPTPNSAGSTMPSRMVSPIWPTDAEGPRCQAENHSRPGLGRRRAGRGSGPSRADNHTQSLKTFARQARKRLRTDGGGSRRAYLRALAPRVEVDAQELRIMGAKSELLRTLIAASGAKSAGFGVPSSLPKWRPREDSNLRPAV